MSIQKSLEEIELIRDSALLVSKTLGLLANEIKEGVTTLMLDKIAEEFIRDRSSVLWVQYLTKYHQRLIYILN